MGHTHRSGHRLGFLLLGDVRRFPAQQGAGERGAAAHVLHAAICAFIIAERYAAGTTRAATCGLELTWTASVAISARTIPEVNSIATKQRAFDLIVSDWTP